MEFFQRLEQTVCSSRCVLCDSLPTVANHHHPPSLALFGSFSVEYSSFSLLRCP